MGSSVHIDRAALLDSLIKATEEFANQFPLENFKRGNCKQHPLITLLTCSDSRMPVNIFGCIFNRIFSVENIGNQLRSSEGSVLYGLIHLHTPIMIVAGHTDCGAIKAATSNFLVEPLGIRSELSIVKDSLDAGNKLYGINSPDDSEIFFTHLSEINVDMQINYLLANPVVNTLVANRELLILGLMVDLHNHYDSGYGQTYLINVNGERRIEIIKTYKEMIKFVQQAKRLTK